MSPKLDFNTKILLTSWIMHRFQRFLMFWKAECLLFHLETTFPHCFVFVRSITWHLWKVCLIYWTNAGSSIPVLALEGYDYEDISANMQNLPTGKLGMLAMLLDCVLTIFELNPSILAMLCSIHTNPLSEPGVGHAYCSRDVQGTGDQFVASSCSGKSSKPGTSLVASAAVDPV